MLRQVVLATALSLAVGAGWAQMPAAPAAVPPPPPPRDALRRMPSPMQGAPVQLSGVIDRFLVNPNGDVDGLLLRDQTQVDVPPHLSPALTANLHRGDRIRVTGFRIGTLPVLRAALIVDAAGHTIVQDTPPTVPPAPRTPPALQPMQAAGHVSHLIYGPQGDVTGVLLDDGTVLRLPPPAALQASALLQPGSELSAQGFGVSTPYGRSMQVTAIGRDRASEQALMPPPPPPAGRRMPGQRAVLPSPPPPPAGAIPPSSRR